MKHLELHILQSVPVACLNRDDLNSPKTAVFGGIQRARVSSQSWKRAIREMAKEISPQYYKGERTRRFVYILQNLLLERSIKESTALRISEHIANIVETLDSKTDEAGIKKIKTLLFLSDSEYKSIADGVSSAEDVINSLETLGEALEDLSKAENDALKKCEKKVEEVLKSIKTLSKSNINKMIQSVQLKDAADIALFGRMVASSPSLTVEAASMFSHALSTHKADNEIDFFSAVDDTQSKDEAGAGMTGTLEFNSATYYRFAALNLDMLADTSPLKGMTKEERQEVIRTFVTATIKAIPSARKNSMNGNTLPVYVLGIVKEQGHPLQLINAFEDPIRSSDGLVIESINRMCREYSERKTWGIKSIFSKAVVGDRIKEKIKGCEDIETCSFDELVEGAVQHVR